MIHSSKVVPHSRGKQLLSFFPSRTSGAMAKRLAPDPTLGLSDLLKPIVEWLKEQGSQNLWKLLEPVQPVTWKTAPDVAWLVQLSGLYTKLLKVSPTCCYPSKKLRMALERIQSGYHRINYTKFNDDQFYDKADLLIRQGAAQLRTLKTDQTQYCRALKKADPKQCETLESLLSMLALPELEKTTSTALVPYEEPKASDAAAEKAESLKMEVDSPPTKIFSRILARKSSDEAGEPAKGTSSASSSSLPKQGTTRTEEGGSQRFLKRMSMDFTKSDKQMLAELLTESLVTPTKATKEHVFVDCVVIFETV